jgi:hypothetical protein
MTGARQAVCAKKIRRAGGARRISPTSFRSEAGGPSQGELPGREQGVVRNRQSQSVKFAGSAVESGEMMIPPASQAESDLVHMARAFTRKFISRAQFH